MENCLVLKCKGTVENDSLLKVGELRIKQNKIDSPTSLTQAIIVNGSNIDAEIIGDGYFTDKALTANLGKSITNIKSPIYISNSDCEISIKNKYNITALAFRESYITQWVDINRHVNNKKIDLESLKYSHNIMSITVNADVDISALSNLTTLTSLIIQNKQVTGDISALANMTNMSHLLLDTNITGDISSLANMTNISYISLDTNITGDISALANMTKLRELYIYSINNITGDLSAFANITELQSIILLPTNVTGDISVFRNNAKLTSLRASNTIGINGDLAVVSETFKTINLNNKCQLTWSTRKSTANIISISGSPKMDNIDKMLQDQANCVVPSSISEKIIAVTGTRTSASDEAVRILQNKGYTITINPA